MLKPDDTALVLLDIQGKLASSMAQKEKLFRNLRILIQGVQILEIPIYWMEQYPQGLGPTVPEVAELLTGRKPLSKLSFSACGQKDFLEQLQTSRRRQLLLAGIETHVCVYQTARDLLQQAYHVEVVLDATSSRSLENKQVGVDKMVRAGAETTSVEAALFELLQTSGAPQFKQISSLVR